MKTGIIYGYMNKENEKWYVGQSLCPIKRKKDHIRNQKKYEKNNFKNGKGLACPKFYKAVSKYGWDSFEYVILEESVLLKDLNDREVFWGMKKNSLKNGYNLALGGAGTSAISEEVLKNMSIRVKGKNNPMYGKYGSKNAVSKPIIEMLLDGTIKTYENAVDFINKTKDNNIKARSLNGCCARKKYVFLNKYCVSYKDNFDIEKAKEAIDKIKKYKKYDKPFYELDENLNIIKKYKSLYSLEADINLSKIKRVLKRKCNNVFGRKFIFEDEYLNMSKLEVKKRFSPKSTKSQKIRKGKKIKCLNDNNVFISISQASSFYKMSKDSIGKGLSGERKHCGYYNNEQMFFQYI